MIDSINLIIGITASLLGIIISVISLVHLYRKQFYLDYKLDFRPALVITDVEKQNNKIPFIKSLILVNEGKGDSKIDRCTILPFSLENKSSNAIKNIRIQVEYDRNYFMENEEIFGLYGSKSEPFFDDETNFVMRFKIGNIDEEEKKELKNFRKTSIFRGFAAESIEIPLLRPNEIVTIPYFIMFRNDKIYDNPSSIFGEGGFNNITRKLNELKEIENFLVLNFNIYSENLKPIKRQIKVFEIYSKISNLLGVLNKISKTFWFGSIPVFGIYFIPYIPFRNWYLKRKGMNTQQKNFILRERGAYMKAKYFKINTPQKKVILFNEIENNTFFPFIMSFPNCDYYKLPSSVSSHEELLKYMRVPQKPIYISKKTKKINEFFNLLE